jgi:hypothetical protein
MALQITQSKKFDNFMIFTILLNAVVLGMVDYRYYDAATGEAIREGWRNQLVFGLEPLFTVIFFLECTVKVTAVGFYNKEGMAYIKDPWNWLDFTVVVTSVLSAVPGVPSVSGLRVVRALRPLRALSRFPVMRHLVATLLASFGPLSSVLTVMTFFFVLLGILSIQLWGWNGALHGRCRLTERPIKLEVIHSDPAFVVDAHTNHTFLHSQHILNHTTPCLPKKLDKEILNTNDTGLNCAWPIDDTQHHLCSLPGFAGLGKCNTGTYCGAYAGYTCISCNF